MSYSLFRRKSIDNLMHEKKDAETHSHESLRRVLTVRDLTFFGIAAIIGAGSFSSLGAAVFTGGPGVILLFIICGIACGFTAMCYAEFASRIPISGSAYTYAYASFGELFAWVIGWALIMEYSIGNIYVAFSWSDYFTSLLDRIGWHIPEYFSTSYKEAQHAVEAGSDHQESILAWQNAPRIGGLRMIVDLPAIAIVMFITFLVYRGVKESRNFSNVMVILKLAVIFLVIVVGAFYIDTANWTPVNNTGVKSFLPNGFGGMMLAVSGVFYAYIGFDAVSVLAEESKNPQRDLPRGMIFSLVLCTIIYILLSLVLTGVLDYRRFEGVGDPLAFIFEAKGVAWMQFLVSLVAVVAMTSVLLVFQMGQPRIWMSISRDGLLPPRFQQIHHKFKTPSFSTILTGLLVGIPLLFTDKTFVLDFTSIGTLFAFVLVCGGVLLIPRKEKIPGRFNMPFVNAKYVFPPVIIGVLILLALLTPQYFTEMFNGDFSDYSAATDGKTHIFPTAATKIATIIFWAVNIMLAIMCFFRELSLIPVLGLVTCLYLLTGMSASNWMWFFIWFAIGLVVYFIYGYRNSHLQPKAVATPD
ncbi:APC family permease [Pseudocnuella soli]|uniref:APC family permease n=1 Tax=Pseudocnuella soli TaxID=2502779 RepID=UPI001049C82A|nr:amino acid permease [Pseudocnuella soli]